MYKGVSATLLVITLALAGCGGDDDDDVSDACPTMGMTSTPTGVPGDPCPQNDPMCPGDKYSAVATCGPDLHWKKDAASLIMCACVPKGGSMPTTPGTPGGGMMQNHCGDGIFDGNAGEQCDKLQLNGAKCADMIPGSTKILMCKPDCTYNMDACKMDNGMTGGGGGDEDMQGEGGDGM